MRTIGLIVEGVFDEAALQELVQRCSTVPTTVIPRACGGKKQLFAKFPGYLDLFRHAKQGSCVDKALVVFDADHKDPQAEIKRFAGRITNRSYPFPIKYCVIVQELEAWLLASEVVAPEAFFDARAELETRLSARGVSYTQEVARTLASRVDTQILAQRCQSFHAFPQSVRNGQAVLPTES